MNPHERNPDTAMHILVSFDANYIPPFKTMLVSLALNNLREQIHVWLMHSGLSDEALEDVRAHCLAYGAGFTSLMVDRALFADAPVMKQYPQEMYYRLLAAMLLPPELRRVLYLDPDVLVINSLRPLWTLDMGGCAFAAAAHSYMPEVMNDMNRLRLCTSHDYLNTGVLLMDLDRARQVVRAQDIYAVVRERNAELVLPDQDVFNHLYGKYTMQIDDKLWNYDVRHFYVYKFKSDRVCDVDWVMRHTVILHYCGKNKPWKRKNGSRFDVLYKHYMRLTERMAADGPQRAEDERA